MWQWPVPADKIDYKPKYVLYKIEPQVPVGMLEVEAGKDILCQFRSEFPLRKHNVKPINKTPK